jgi:hypothetical protein
MFSVWVRNYGTFNLLDNWKASPSKMECIREGHCCFTILRIHMLDYKLCAIVRAIEVLRIVAISFGIVGGAGALFCAVLEKWPEQVVFIETMFLIFILISVVLASTYKVIS